MASVEVSTQTRTSVLDDSGQKGRAESGRALVRLGSDGVGKYSTAHHYSEEWERSQSVHEV
jgi:hypothetical protein